MTDLEVPYMNLTISPIRHMLHYLQKLIPILRQFCLPYPADLPQFGQAAGAAFEDFQQRAVVENHVGRHALFAGEFGAFGFEREP